MNEHDRYMADFLRVFETLDRWGPGLETETLRALSKIPFSPRNILEVGCGKGIATTVLAKHCAANITAVDNDAPALNRLSERAKETGVDDRVTTVCASMTDLPFEAASFDVIWSEASAYIMGVTHAMEQWRSLLKDQGVLVISDLVWRTSSPSADVLAFWQKGYPGMTTTQERIEQAEAAGYQVLDNFALSECAWKAYFEPLQARVNALKHEMEDSSALRDIQTELEIYHSHLDEFGYQMFVLKSA